MTQKGRGFHQWAQVFLLAGRESGLDVLEDEDADEHPEADGSAERAKV